MQINGTDRTMATTEPPEPPPRNPDRVNLSLNRNNNSKITKSLDISDKTGDSNKNKAFKQAFSIDQGSSVSSSTNIENAAVVNTGTPIMTTPINEENKTFEVKNQNDNNLTPTNATLPGPSNSNNFETTSPKDEKSLAIGPQTSNSDPVENVAAISTTSKNLTNSNHHNNIGEDERTFINGKFSSIPESDTEHLYSTVNLEAKRGAGKRPKSLENEPRLLLENEKLTAEIDRLRTLLENFSDGAIGGNLPDKSKLDGQSENTNRIEYLENELKKSKQQITGLRVEKEKLRTEKTELLAHVKQLCLSLQEKEQELRNFIRNFEQRIRETETSNSKISSERERERWSLLKHARDESERSIALAHQLNVRDLELQRTQEQLQEAKRQLSGCLSDQESIISFAPLTPPSSLMSHISGNVNTLTTAGSGGFNADRGSCSADSGVRGSSDRESTVGDLNLSDGTCENGPYIKIDPDNISVVSSQCAYQYETPKERSPAVSPLNSSAYSSRSVEHLGSPVDFENVSQRKFPSKLGTGTLGRSGRGGAWGSISRVFARSKNKNKLNSQETFEDTANWSPLTEEGYAEKLRLLREASHVSIDKWRASQVLAWLEVALGMPQYSIRCSENVKSGKVLLELNDAELESGFGLAHPMHRKKLRLAIEEQRRPDLIRYPLIAQLGHTWVASEWLADIGLQQYAETFLQSLVDARMLDTLSKKELEKFLGITKKFHQASIVHGIHVLRIVKYDRQMLAMRRYQSENVDTDPIVWTNQRFIRWAKSIDLNEYADNLKDSGVHGGLVILEPSFSGDTMATALGIPLSKNIIRRHLSTEFEALVLPASFRKIPSKKFGMDSDKSKIHQ